jgi:hypothetical protein
MTAPVTSRGPITPTPYFVPADSAVPYPAMTGDEPCRQDPETWFPEQGQNGTVAQALCHTCPVLAQCRRWALANPQLASDGIWGGMTRSQRAAERRNAVEAACTTRTPGPFPFRTYETETCPC